MKPKRRIWLAGLFVGAAVFSYALGYYYGSDAIFRAASSPEGIWIGEPQPHSRNITARISPAAKRDFIAANAA